MKSVSPSALNYTQYVDHILDPEDIHDAERVTPATATNGLFVVMAIILTVLHAFNLYLFLGTGMWPVIPLLIHLFISAITLLIAYAQYRKGMDVQHLALLAIVASVAGIFGAVGALLGFFFTVIFRGRSHHFSEWYETIFPTDVPTEPQTIYDSITEGLDENPSNYSVMPFNDVMRLGSENQKRRALAKMTSRFSPRFAPAFKAALSDNNNTIRVQAATAIAKVEREFADLPVIGNVLINANLCERGEILGEAAVGHTSNHQRMGRRSPVVAVDTRKRMDFTRADGQQVVEVIEAIKAAIRFTAGDVFTIKPIADTKVRLRLRLFLNVLHYVSPKEHALRHVIAFRDAVVVVA
jgi:hypothetical protein